MLLNSFSNELHVKSYEFIWLFYCCFGFHRLSNHNDGKVFTSQINIILIILTYPKADTHCKLQKKKNCLSQAFLNLLWRQRTLHNLVVFSNWECDSRFEIVTKDSPMSLSFNLDWGFNRATRDEQGWSSGTGSVLWVRSNQPNEYLLLPKQWRKTSREYRQVLKPLTRRYMASYI